MNLFASNCWINLIYIDDSIALEIKLDNVLTTLNKGEIRDLNLLEQVGFDEFWNNNVSLWHRLQTLCSDGCEMLHHQLELKFAMQLNRVNVGLF
jgi:hypothetical protein